MTERMIREASWNYIPLVLKSGEVAEKGKLACLDTANNGALVAGKTAVGLVPIGIFAETLTGDGVKTISVQMFHELKMFWWVNDTVSAVTAADIGLLVSIKDAQTVSHDATGRSVAGLAMAIDSAKGVLVLSSPFLVAS